MKDGRRNAGSCLGRMIKVLLIAALVVAGLAALAWWWGRTPPAYWQVVDPASPQVQQQAAAFERRMTTQVTQVREGEPDWTLEVTQAQVNHWLAARLPRWLENQGIAEQVDQIMRHPMVVFEDGRVIIAAEVDLRGMNQVVSLVYQPGTSRDGQVVLDLQGIRAGKLGVPTEALLEQVRARAPLSGEQREAMEEGLSMIESIPLTLPLDDGRIVRVMGMEVADGTAAMTLRTEREKSTSASK